MMEHAPIFIIITPLAGALVLGVISRFITNQHIKDLIALISLAIPVILLFYFAPLLLENPIRYEVGGWPSPYGITLVLDSLSATMATIVGMVTLTSFVYSLEAREILPQGEKYYFLFLFMTTGLYGVFLTGDLINRYVFFELTILTTYVLLTYTDSRESLKASFNYLIIGSIASFFFLAGIGLLYFNTGILDFNALSKIVPEMTLYKRNIIFAFFLVAIGVKAGLIPFHSWLPDAHVSAPDPMTAVLGGVTVKTGAYILIKFLKIGFLTPFIQHIIIALGVSTAIAGVIISLTYWDLKRILAWITISQMGLIITVLIFWTPISVAAGLYHLINHALFKTLLFLSVGGMAYLYGTRDIREIPILRAESIFAGSFIIGLLSIIGIPPLNGFYSKTLMLRAFSSNTYLYIIFLIVHFLTVLSFLRVIYHSDKSERRRYVPTSILTPISVLAGLCIFVGATSTIWINNVILPSSAVIVEESYVVEFVFIESGALFSYEGLFLMIISLLAIIPLYIFKDIKLERTKELLTNVSIPSAVRYIIFILVVYLILLFI